MEVLKNLTEKAIEILRAGVARAKEFPEGFDMDWWATLDDEAPCGTVGCLAFEICVVNGADPKDLAINWPKIQLQADNILAVASDSMDLDTRSLFSTPNWPTSLFTRYYSYKTSQEGRIDILEEAVELWITNDGKFPEEL